MIIKLNGDGQNLSSLELNIQHNIVYQFAIHSEILCDLGYLIYRIKSKVLQSIIRERIELHIYMQDELYSIARKHQFSKALVDTLNMVDKFEIKRKLSSAVNDVTNKVLILNNNLTLPCFSKTTIIRIKDIFANHYSLLDLYYSSAQFSSAFKQII